MRLPHRFTGEGTEAGETLVEVIIASALMAVIVVALIAGIGTIVLGGHVHREQTDANTSLVAAAERVKSSALTRVPCATSANYLSTAQAASPALPAGWTISIASIEYENFDSTGVSWDTTCHETSTNTLGLQRITLQLSSADGRVNPKLSVVKGDY
jgi:hypothetical protein